MALAGVTEVIQAALLTAVHVQPIPDVTVKVAVPPAAIADALLELSVGLQPFAWLTVNVCWAIVMVPLLAMPVLAATS